MKYHQYYPLSAGMSFGIQEAYNKLIKSYIADGKLAHASITELERSWVANKRPYYRVPPDTLEYMLRLDITANPTVMTSFHYDAVSFNFAEGNELHGIHSILAGKYTFGKAEIIAFSCQGPWTGTKFCCLPFPSDKIMVDVFEKITEDASKLAGFDNRSQACDVMQLLCATWSIHAEPELLARDQHKPPTYELWQRAHNRGKVGWKLDHKVERTWNGRIGSN